MEKSFGVLSALQPLQVPWSQPLAAIKVADKPAGLGAQALAIFPSPVPVLSDAWRWLAASATALTGLTAFVGITLHVTIKPDLMARAAVSSGSNTVQSAAHAASSTGNGLLLSSPASASASARPREQVAIAPAAVLVVVKREQRVVPDRVAPKASVPAPTAPSPVTETQPLAVAAPVTPQQVQLPAPSSPEESCANKGLLGRLTCVSELCSKPALALHADCKRLRHQLEQAEQQRLYGGS